MKWIDLFAGAGLASLAAKLSGSEVIAAFDLGYKKGLRIDTSPLRTYQLNHGNHIVQQDVSTLTGKQLKALGADGVMGGPPCQDYSISGKKAGFHGETGFLVRNFMEIACEARPRWILMENVKGILSNEDAMTYLEKMMKDWDYVPGWYNPLTNTQEWYHLFNSAHFGSAQKRERVFFLFSRCPDFVYIPDGRNTTSKTMGQVLGIDLPNDGLSPTIDAGGTATGGWDLPSGSRAALARMGFTGRLTTEQCALLQGVPDWYKFVGNKTSVHRQIGNGWEIESGKRILFAITRTHERYESGPPRQ